MLKKVTHLILTATVALAANAQTEGKNPFSFEASYIGDTYYNTTGGLKHGGGFMGMGNIAIYFDTGTAGWWKGGSFFINGASIHGKSLTENYLGDLQVASNIDAGEHSYLHELWLCQQLGQVLFTLGLQDLNAEFMVSEGGGEFINSSFGTPSVVALEVPVPIFPLTGLGVSTRWNISDRWTIQGALFDGSQTDFDRNPHNVHWNFGKNDGLLSIGEIHFDGRYKFGAYHHSLDNNYGFYLLADQSLGQRVELFGQAVIAPEKKNENNYYIGLGANLSGVFGEQQYDAAGIAIAHAGLHRTGHKHETTFEFYYKYQFNSNITLQPDIQYILNPSGGEAILPNALVGMLRFHVNF